MTKLKTALAAALMSVAAALPAFGAGDAPTPPSQKWSFDGLFGRYDRDQLRRGLDVYVQVCALCHGLRHVAYRDLGEIGLKPSEIRKVAIGDKKVRDIGDDGQPKERAAALNDRFVSPFPNAAAAKATHGVEPPDLSLMVKAREHGANYIFALLTGYADPPKDVKLEGNQAYNKYFPGGIISMAPPITKDTSVTYTKYEDQKAAAPAATPEQMARDVSAFLAWAAEPILEERKRMGLKVMLFLLLMTGVFFAIKRKIWADVH
jgi:ubiquinol-cytochrome c reductase cytochrome c1 subunit